MVQFMMPDGEIKKARVLFNQPKWTGRSKDWLNVKLVESDDPSSVDWGRIQWWRKIAQPAQIVLLSAANEYEQKVMAAKLKEMSNLENNKKRSHTQLDSRKQVIAFQDRVITINIKEAQHPLK